MLNKNSFLENKDSKINSILDQDRWHASDLGLDPDKAQGGYYLDFSKLKVQWIKRISKRFVLFQSSTKSYNTCRSYISSISKLDQYIVSLNVPFLPEHLKRVTVLDFLRFLSSNNYQLGTRITIFYNIKAFYEVSVMQAWLPFVPEDIFDINDLPKQTEKIPKFIPDHVLKQFKQNINKLPGPLYRVIVVLMETGRRVSEICALFCDCIEKDKEGDYFLRFLDKKMKKNKVIPISNQCSDVIKAQKNYLKERGLNKDYLFPSKYKCSTPFISARFINYALNNFAKMYNITNASGELWRFNAHQFRHTLATNMINSGVSQVMVQKYLGHESSEMTARYAHIHDKTMKNEFLKYKQNLVDINGHSKTLNSLGDLEWLKNGIASQSLPNGFCTLPVWQQKCPHANACLTCSNFKTSKKYLDNHKKQLLETTEIIDQAKQNEWERVVQANKEIQTNLRVIISKLEAD